MWEFFVDLIELIGMIVIKKKKKKKKELISSEKNDSAQKQESSREVKGQNGSICAGCNRILEKGAIYELGKSWCTECYKTHVLKIKD